MSSLATVLQGNGAQLNSLIHNASGTIGTLAQKGNELGQLLGALGQLTGTLDKQNGLIGQFINNYNTVSGVLADNRILTLLAELANLKTIIGRFSDFAKMPPPQFEEIDVNEIVRGVMKLHDARFHAASPLSSS